MRFLTLLFIFFLLCGVPGAHAACLTLDCSQDPQAWADMFGDSPGQRAEQQAAREAADAFIAGRDEEKHRAMVAGFGITERYRMVHTLEDTFSRVIGKPYTVIAAVVVPRGSGYLFCGSGFYGLKPHEGGVFIFDTNAGGTRLFSADRDEFSAAGCNDALAVTLR